MQLQQLGDVGISFNHMLQIRRFRHGLQRLGCNSLLGLHRSWECTASDVCKHHRGKGPATAFMCTHSNPNCGGSLIMDFGYPWTFNPKTTPGGYQNETLNLLFSSEQQRPMGKKANGGAPPGQNSSQSMNMSANSEASPLARKS